MQCRNRRYPRNIARGVAGVRLRLTPVYRPPSLAPRAAPLQIASALCLNGIARLWEHRAVADRSMACKGRQIPTSHMASQADAASRRRGVWLAMLGALSNPASAITAQPNPDIVEHRQAFTVDAWRPDALHRQLSHDGPVGRDGRTHAGLTTASIEVRFTLDPASGHCTLRMPRVSADIIVHLPRWQPRREPAPGTAEAWERVRTALTMHEDGHRQHAIAAAHELLARLRELPPMPDCEKLDRAAQRVRSRVLAKLQARDHLYDLATDFGRLPHRPASQ